jgi:hypothetical protein
VAVRAHPPRHHRAAHGTWSPGTTFGLGAVVGALSATALVLAMLLPWRETDIYPREIPVEFLWNRGATNEPSLLILLVPLAVLLVVGVVLPSGAGLRLFAGLGTLVTVGVFAFQLNRVVDSVPGTDRSATFDTGFYVAALAGILAFVSALLTASSGRWREAASVKR